MSGSLFKHKRSGLWTVKFHIGGGKYQQRYFATRAEAAAYQSSQAMHPGHMSGLGVEGRAGERLKGYVAEWLRQQEPRLRAKTLDTYEVLAKHITDHLGSVPLARLGPRAVEDFYARLREKGLSPTTQHHIANLLHKLLADAVRKDIIRQNPCAFTTPPSRSRREMRVLDEEQIKLFLGEARRSSPHHALYLMAVTTGMREGELLGLRWKDLSLTLGRASVTQTFSRFGSYQVFGEPKTRGSRRNVPLPPALVEELGRLRGRQAEQRRRLGARYEDHDLVFCQHDGKPLHINNVRRRDFRKVLERAGLPRIRFHDLRHTLATWHFQNGTHPKIVQELLGHASIRITMDTYSHVLPGMAEEAVDRLQARLLSTPAVHLSGGETREAGNL